MEEKRGRGRPPKDRSLFEASGLSEVYAVQTDSVHGEQVSASVNIIVVHKEYSSATIPDTELPVWEKAGWKLGGPFDAAQG